MHVWGTLYNLGGTPIQLRFGSLFFSFWSSSSLTNSFLSYAKIINFQDPKSPLWLRSLTLSNWKDWLWARYPRIIGNTYLGCTTFQVNDPPSKLLVVPSVDSWNIATRLDMEDCLLLELEKLEQDGIIKKTLHDPQICIPVFGVPPKDGTIRVVMKFCKLNSCILHGQFNICNCSCEFPAVRPFAFAPSFDSKMPFFRSSCIPS